MTAYEFTSLRLARSLFEIGPHHRLNQQRDGIKVVLSGSKNGTGTVVQGRLLVSAIKAFLRSSTTKDDADRRMVELKSENERLRAVSPERD